jgi:hypothetical protein
MLVVITWKIMSIMADGTLINWQTSTLCPITN